MSRIQKVAEALKREISYIIQDHLKDSRIGFITITRVDLSGDLRNAKVYFSILGNRNQEKKTQSGLESAKGFIRKLLAQRLKIRYVPEIAFKLDRSVQYSIHITEIIDRLHTHTDKDGLPEGN